MVRRMAFVSHKTFHQSKAFRVLIIVGVLFVSVAVFLGMREYRRAQTFEGVVVEKDRSLKWRYWSDTTRSDRTRYRHFLVLETDDGELIRTRVRWRTHLNAEIGDPVVKRRGETWPQLMSDEAIERREGSERAMDLMLDAIRGDEGDP